MCNMGEMSAEFFLETFVLLQKDFFFFWYAQSTVTDQAADSLVCAFMWRVRTSFLWSWLKDKLLTHMSLYHWRWCGVRGGCSLAISYGQHWGEMYGQHLSAGDHINLLFFKSWYFWCWWTHHGISDADEPIVVFLILMNPQWYFWCWWTRSGLSDADEPTAVFLVLMNPPWYFWCWWTHHGISNADEPTMVFLMLINPS